MSVLAASSIGKLIRATCDCFLRWMLVEVNEARQKHTNFVLFDLARAGQVNGEPARVESNRRRLRLKVRQYLVFILLFVFVFVLKLFTASSRLLREGGKFKSRFLRIFFAHG